MTDRLIHPTEWDRYLRYATHQRNSDWRPPLVTFAVAKIQQAAESLTARQVGLFLLFVCGYAESPILNPEAGHCSARAFLDRPATWARRVNYKVTSDDKDAWSKAGLIEFTTVEQPLIDGRPPAGEQPGLEREPEVEPEHDREPGPLRDQDPDPERELERERERDAERGRERAQRNGEPIVSVNNRSAVDGGEQDAPGQVCEECGGVHPDRPWCPLLKDYIRVIERKKKRVSPEQVNAFRVANGKEPWTWD